MSEVFEDVRLLMYVVVMRDLEVPLKSIVFNVVPGGVEAEVLVGIPSEWAVVDGGFVYLHEEELELEDERY